MDSLFFYIESSHIYSFVETGRLTWRKVLEGRTVFYTVGTSKAIIALSHDKSDGTVLLQAYDQASGDLQWQEHVATRSGDDLEEAEDFGLLLASEDVVVLRAPGGLVEARKTSNGKKEWGVTTTSKQGSLVKSGENEVSVVALETGGLVTVDVKTGKSSSQKSGFGEEIEEVVSVKGGLLAKTAKGKIVASGVKMRYNTRWG